MITLYRDDDINKYTDINLFKKVHELFVKHNKVHTIAVEMEDIWRNKELWYFLMTADNLAIGLHGWTHKDYGETSYVETLKDIRKSLQYFHYYTTKGKYKKPPIKTFYPPWNNVSDDLIEACKHCGLEVDSRVGGEVYNFHYWAFTDDDRFKRLEEALKS